MDDNKKLLKKIALFCTAGGESRRYATKCSKDLENICSKKPVAFLGLNNNDIKEGFSAKIAGFISVIQNPQKSN